MEADSLTGLWSIAGAVPDHAESVLKQAIDESGVDLLDGESADLNVYISTTPAALVVTDGEPQFATVDGTNLHRVTNTTANVFKEPTDHALYVVASERWYRAWTTNGPWQYVPDVDLPTDLCPLE